MSVTRSVNLCKRLPPTCLITEFSQEVDFLSGCTLLFIYFLKITHITHIVVSHKSLNFVESKHGNVILL